MDLQELIDLDIRYNYKTKVPEALSHNKFGAKDELFRQYRRRLINQKRNLELTILRENKKQEITNAIVDIVNKYEAEQRSAQLRSKTVMEKYKTFIGTTRKRF